MLQSLANLRVSTRYSNNVRVEAELDTGHFFSTRTRPDPQGLIDPDPTRPGSIQMPRCVRLVVKPWLYKKA